MKRTTIALSLALLGLALAVPASADVWDVIELKLTDKCDLEKYLEIVEDFNAYYTDRGYQTEILIPLHAETQDSLFWIGRTADTETFGRAYDHWVAERVKSGTEVSKLDSRFEKCSNLVSRSSYLNP